MRELRMSPGQVILHRPAANTVAGARGGLPRNGARPEPAFSAAWLLPIEFDRNSVSVELRQRL